MRVLQVSHNYHIVGGSDSVFFATSKLLTEAGHQIVPFCIDSPNNLHSHWNRYFPSGADTACKPIVDGLQYFYNASARRNLNRLLDDVRHIDVAHLHIYHGKHTPAILPILKARGIPAERLMDGVQSVDYAGFVDLAATHDRTQSWL